LPDTNIEGTVGILIGSIAITTAFVGYNALAASLVPAGKFGTLICNIYFLSKGVLFQSIFIYAGYSPCSLRFHKDTWNNHLKGNFPTPALTQITNKKNIRHKYHKAQ
jgi:hypothetical protein